MAHALLFSDVTSPSRSRLPLLTDFALRSSATGWIAAFYGALYICAAGDLRATQTLWIFGWPFAAMLGAATAAHAWLAGGGGVLGLASPLRWVRTTNVTVARLGAGEAVDDDALAVAIARLPAVPIAHTMWCSALSAAVVAGMALLEWRVSGTTRNVSAIMAGGAIAMLLYGAATFTVCELLVGPHCHRVRRAGVGRGLDPYAGPTVDTWMRVVVLVSPTVLALAVALRLTMSEALPLAWLAQAALVVVSAAICGALGWLHAVAIRRAAADLADAATGLAHGERVTLVTGAIDAHVVGMARAFNAAANAVTRSRESSAARYAALFEGAGDAILLIDAATGTVLEANRCAEELTGHDVASLRSKPFGSLFVSGGPDVHATGRAGAWARSTRIARADGTTCPVDVALSVVPLAEGAVVQAIVHDMRERERIESELRHAVQRLEGLYHLAVTLGGSVEEIADHLTVTLGELLDAPLVAAARFDGDEVTLLAVAEGGAVTRDLRLPLRGSAFEHVRAVQRACALVGAMERFPADGFLQEHGVETFAAVPVVGRSGTIAGAVALLDCERRAMGDEDMRLLSSYAQRLAAAFDEQAYAREREAFVREVSSQNLALTVAQERLTQADRVKSEFLGMMSHELRTPINIFIGYTELLLDAARGLEDLGPEEHRAVLDRMRDAARTLASLVEDTLSVLRLESAGVAVNAEPVVLGALCDELRAADRFLASDAAVREEWVIGSDVPTLVSDRLKLRQILTNLVGNARKFTRAGTIRVRIARAANATITVAVEDTGCGIDPAELPFIFDLYRQAANGGVHNGCGIGLYIVRRYCELLGGGVSVASELGRGTSFIVTLPERVPEREGRPTTDARSAA